MSLTNLKLKAESGSHIHVILYKEALRNASAKKILDDKRSTNSRLIAGKSFPQEKVDAVVNEEVFVPELKEEAVKATVKKPARKPRVKKEAK